MGLKEIDQLIEAIEEIMNLLGGPTMTYAPEIENKEREERILLAHKMLMRIWKRLKDTDQRN